MTKYDDMCEAVVTQLVGMIEQGTDGQWSCPWHDRPEMFAPINVKTGKAYKGGNVIAFAMAAIVNGWETTEFATYKQFQALSTDDNPVCVRKGETGTKGVRWVRKKDKKTGEELNGMFPVTFTVFNVAQVDGFEATPREVIEADWDVDSVRVGDAADWLAGIGADIRHGGNRAFYSPSSDYVQVPDCEQFTDKEGYYGTLLHELTHWTGHKSRLDRFEAFTRFGDEAYALEELVAEIGAATLCAQLEISNEPRDDHAKYLASWLKVLRAEPKTLFTVSTKASAAVTHLNAI